MSEPEPIVAAAPFRPLHVEREHTITLPAPLAVVAPLFTPSGERSWVPGWDPRPLHPAGGGDRDGAIFVTSEGGETTLWATALHDPAGGRYRYVRVTPGSRSALVDVLLEPADTARAASTAVTVRYAITALSERGNAYLRAWTAEAFAAGIEGWRRDLVALLRPSPAPGRALDATPAAGGAPAIRAAAATDAAAIARIYNEGIEDRVATFETEPRTADDIVAWFEAPYPVVVALEGGEVVAFAVASMYRPRACYRDIGEFSVYVARAARGRGHGARAMRALFVAARAAGLRKLVSRVFVENEPSRRLLRRLGFREVGVYVRHGHLDGRWRDVVVVERLLDEEGDATGRSGDVLPPSPPLS